MDYSKFVVLAVCRTKDGILRAFFFDADYFRFSLCQSKHLDIVYTVHILRSACPEGVIIYGYPNNSPCFHCNINDCGDCRSL